MALANLPPDILDSIRNHHEKRSNPEKCTNTDDIDLTSKNFSTLSCNKSESSPEVPLSGEWPTSPASHRLPKHRDALQYEPEDSSPAPHQLRASNKSRSATRETPKITSKRSISPSRRYHQVPAALDRNSGPETEYESDDESYNGSWNQPRLPEPSVSPLEASSDPRPLGTIISTMEKSSFPSSRRNNIVKNAETKVLSQSKQMAESTQTPSSAQFIPCTGRTTSHSYTPLSKQKLVVKSVDWDSTLYGIEESTPTKIQTISLTKKVSPCTNAEFTMLQPAIIPASMGSEQEIMRHANQKLKVGASPIEMNEAVIKMQIAQKSTEEKCLSEAHVIQTVREPSKIAQFAGGGLPSRQPEPDDTTTTNNITQVERMKGNTMHNRVQLSSAARYTNPNGFFFSIPRQWTSSSSKTPFDAFQQEYTEFSSSLRTFVRACVILESLKEERRLPSFLYDDFIRAFSGPFLNYLSMKTQVDGRRLLTAIEWYCENIDSPVFCRGVITSMNIGLVLVAYPDIVISVRGEQRSPTMDAEGDASTSASDTESQHDIVAAVETEVPMTQDFTENQNASPLLTQAPRPGPNETIIPETTYRRSFNDNNEDINVNKIIISSPSHPSASRDTVPLRKRTLAGIMSTYDDELSSAGPKTFELNCSESWHESSPRGQITKKRNTSMSSLNGINNLGPLHSSAQPKMSLSGRRRSYRNADTREKLRKKFSKHLDRVLPLMSSSDKNNVLDSG